MPSNRGELGLPNQHAIAATHQGADSNEVLARRGRCVAHAEAWRSDGVTSASCGDGRVDDVALLSEAGRAQFFKSVLSDANWSWARVVACHELWGSPSGPPGGLFAQKTLGTDQIISCGGFCLVGLSTVLSTGIGGFRSAFDLCLELRRQGRVPGHCDIQLADLDAARSDAVE